MKEELASFLILITTTNNCKKKINLTFILFYCSFYTARTALIKAIFLCHCVVIHVSFRILRIFTMSKSNSQTKSKPKTQPDLPEEIPCPYCHGEAYITINHIAFQACPRCGGKGVLLLMGPGLYY